MNNKLFVSIIVPVHNGEKHIERCLSALTSSSYQSFEIILVDDCSTDNTVKKAQQKLITLLQLPVKSGPAKARNFGAQYARGDILLFIDSDVIVRRETISLVADNFHHNPDIVALFGSYDDDPEEDNFLSQYRNLFHHFHHQQSNSNAFSFWAGCGAIRKKIFEEVGGFDSNRFHKPSIEDIELGYRVIKNGYRILLDKDLQVKHLKRWDFFPMLRTDIFQRAIPWSRLIIETKFMPKDLNLQMSHKVSSITVALMVIMFPLLFFDYMNFFDVYLTPAVSLIMSILFIVLLVLNRKLYGFYKKKKGLKFMLKVIPLHFLYYLYSGMSFVFSWMSCRIPILRNRDHEGDV